VERHPLKKKDSRPGAKAPTGSDMRKSRPAAKAGFGAKSAKPSQGSRRQSSERGPDRSTDYVRPAQRPQGEPVKRAPVAEKLAEQVPARDLLTRSGELPTETVPVILSSNGAGDFHIIDSGNGLKLEQYGNYRIVRPEAQALWRPTLPERVWNNVDAIFTGDTDEEAMGRWRFPKEQLGETWPLSLLGVNFLGRFTSFRHVGVFPEQIVHWTWLKETIEGAGRPLKVLNLFGYTGVASLVAAAAGAEVTHVDASKKAINWAKENQHLAGLDDAPIRWICEDAMKFIQREERRGNTYDIILTDPPRFGRGTHGEIWQLFDHLPLMLDICREILSKDALGLVLTAYSIRASFFSMHELLREIMRGAGGNVTSGELVIKEAGLDGKTPGRTLSTSMFSRWEPK
jgi:23S rRNA (cytosine1962-C5)-methyltransferase